MSDEGPREPQMGGKNILQVIPAPPGWRARYTDKYGVRDSYDVAVWAICDFGEGKQVIGMVPGRSGRLALVSEMIDYDSPEPAFYTFQTPERWEAQDDAGQEEAARRWEARDEEEQEEAVRRGE